MGQVVRCTAIRQGDGIVQLRYFVCIDESDTELIVSVRQISTVRPELKLSIECCITSATCRHIRPLGGAALLDG